MRNPQPLKCWIRYLEFKKNFPLEEQFYLYERCVQDLPKSYKIWKKYLDLRLEVTSLQDRGPVDAANNCFERSLLFLPLMPRLWICYGKFLLAQKRTRLALKTLNRAIRTLPVLQHDRIWPLLMEIAAVANFPLSIGNRLYRRYLQLDPAAKEQYVEFLLEREAWDLAALELMKIVNDPAYVSPKGKTNFQLTQDLCKVVCEHCDQISSLSIPAFLRESVEKFPNQRSMLWCTLANFYIIRGEFSKARDAFLDALNSVTSVEDFSRIFNSYYTMEESLAEAFLREKQSLTNDRQNSCDQDLELLTLRMQRLLDEREVLLSETLIRRNPNNTFHWNQKILLFSHSPQEVSRIYEEALAAINPKRSIGGLAKFWIAYANWALRDLGDYGRCREIYERAVTAPQKNVQDLALIWIAYCEMEIVRTRSNEITISLLERATSAPSKVEKRNRVHENEQDLIYKNVTLWEYLLDVFEVSATHEQICQAYNKMIDLKICTVQTFVNFAMYLERCGFLEKSFQVYERGIDVFGFPLAYELWNLYLPLFCSTFQGTRMERLRDLFEQALEGCPTEYAVKLLVVFGEMEERHGLTRNAIRLYDRAAKTCRVEDREKMYSFYIARAADLYGVVATREVFEVALANSPDAVAKRFCIVYSEMETKLGELQRARLIRMHGAQFANPETDCDYWENWHKFEVAYGDEDTYRSMLRVKRSVSTKFSASIVVQRSLAQPKDDLAFVPAVVK